MNYSVKTVVMIIFWVTFIFLCSCKTEADFLTIKENKIVFSALADATNVSCSSNTEVRAVSSQPTWCTATVTKNGKNILIGVSNYDVVEKDRTATVTVTAGKAKAVYIGIRQEPQKEEEKNEEEVTFDEALSSKVAVNINGDPKSNMGFNWVTNIATAGRVQIVEGITTDFTSPYKTVQSNEAFFNDEYVQKAVATGLQPGTTYSYRVGNGKNWSDIGKFTTAPEGKPDFSFLYTTDPQGTTDEDFQISGLTHQAAMTTSPNAKFWIGCGDHISNGTTDEWNWYFKYMKDAHLNLPYSPVRGNHETLGNSKSFQNYFNTVQIATENYPGSTYSFVYGDVLFLAYTHILNSNYDANIANMAKWMREEVKKYPATRWRIAFYHRAVYTAHSTYHGENEAVAPIFDEMNIDLALQGHAHAYEVIGPVYGHNVVSGAISERISTSSGYKGGKYCVDNGTLYFLNSTCGQKKYYPNNKAATSLVPNYESLFTGYVGQPGLPTFSNITVSQDVITVTTYTVSSSGTVAELDKIYVVKTSK